MPNCRRSVSYEKRDTSKIPEGSGSLRLWQYVRDLQYRQGDPRRDMFDVPSVLYGQAEICRYRRANRAIPKEIRHGLPQKGPKRPTEITADSV